MTMTLRIYMCCACGHEQTAERVEAARPLLGDACPILRAAG